MIQRLHPTLSTGGNTTSMKFGAFFLSQAPEDRLTPAQALSEELGQMELAEELGFDSVWLAEHRQTSYCVVSDALTYASYVAARTSRIRIGLAVSVLPLRNPLEFAERATLIDILSNGRLNVGVGRGYSRTEFDTYDQPLEDRRARFEEALDVITRAWTERNFDHEGQFWTFRNVNIYPRPVQQPHPPLYVASSGSPDTVFSVARRGLPILQGDDLLSPRKAGERFGIYREQAGAAGRSESEANAAIANSWVAQKVFLAPTTAAAREFATPYLEWRQRKMMDLQPPGAAPTLTTKLRAKVPGLKSVLSASHQKPENEITADDMLQFGIFGTPDDCIERLREFERAGAQNILCSFTYGGMPGDKVRETMRLFAAEVMPAFQRQAVHHG